VTDKQAFQIFQASILGTLAFNEGRKRILGWDTELMALMPGRFVGQTPKGEASSAAIMGAWLRAWDAANLARK
jgi:hypothetical protein